MNSGEYLMINLWISETVTMNSSVATRDDLHVLLSARRAELL